VKTKEEIKNDIARINNFDSFDRAIRYTFNRELLQSEKEFINKIIDEAMQGYADQFSSQLEPLVMQKTNLWDELSKLASATTGFSFYIQHNLNGTWRVNFTHRKLYDRVREELKFTNNISEALKQAICFLKKYDKHFSA